MVINLPSSRSLKNQRKNKTRRRKQPRLRLKLRPLKRKQQRIKRMLRRQRKLPKKTRLRSRKIKLKLIKPRNRLRRLLRKCGHPPSLKPRLKERKVPVRQLLSSRAFNKRPKIQSKLQCRPNRQPRRLLMARKPARPDWRRPRRPSAKLRVFLIRQLRPLLMALRMKKKLKRF